MYMHNALCSCISSAHPLTSAIQRPSVSSKWDPAAPSSDFHLGTSLPLLHWMPGGDWRPWDSRASMEVWARNCPTEQSLTNGDQSRCIDTSSSVFGVGNSEAQSTWLFRGSRRMQARCLEVVSLGKLSFLSGFILPVAHFCFVDSHPKTLPSSEVWSWALPSWRAQPEILGLLPRLYNDSDLMKYNHHHRH